MPSPADSVSSNHLSIETLTRDPELFVHLGKLPDLKVNTLPDFALYSVMNFCFHCWLYIKGTDVESQSLFKANQSEVLKALLQASSQPSTAQIVTIKSTEGLGGEFEITFDDTNSTYTFSERIYNRSVAGAPVTFEYCAKQVWMLTSLAVFKKDCVCAHLDIANEIGAATDATLPKREWTPDKNQGLGEVPCGETTAASDVIAITERVHSN